MGASLRKTAFLVILILGLAAVRFVLLGYAWANSQTSPPRPDTLESSVEAVGAESTTSSNTGDSMEQRPVSVDQGPFTTLVGQPSASPPARQNVPMGFGTGGRPHGLSSFPRRSGLCSIT